jgi:hypothetical protein
MSIYEDPQLQDAARSEFKGRKLLGGLAVFLALWWFLEAFGLAAWVASVAFTFGFTGRRMTEQSRRLVDWIWCVFLPLVWLGYDPGYFPGIGEPSSPWIWNRPHLILANPWATAALLWEVAWMSVWLSVRTWNALAFCLAAGVLTAQLAIGSYASCFAMAELIPRSLEDGGARDFRPAEHHPAVRDTVHWVATSRRGVQQAAPEQPRIGSFRLCRALRDGRGFRMPGARVHGDAA